MNKDSQIYLVGYMAAGKSTMGKAIAQQLERPFVDLDKEIERAAGLDINSIFETHGEGAFRAIERQVLRAASKVSGQVISTGGGLPVDAGNRSFMRATGVVVYLYLTPEKIFERLRVDRQNRPLIKDLDDAELFKFVNRHFHEREHHYLTAELKYPGDQSVAGLVQLLRDYSK